MLIDEAWDGSAPAEFVLRPAGHAAGLYALLGVVSVATPASGVAAAAVSWSDATAGDPPGAPAAAQAALGAAGQTELAFDRRVVYSDGVAPVVLRLEPFGDLTGLSTRVRAAAVRLA